MMIKSPQEQIRESCVAQAISIHNNLASKDATAILETAKKLETFIKTGK